MDLLNILVNILAWILFITQYFILFFISILIVGYAINYFDSIESLIIHMSLASLILALVLYTNKLNYLTFLE